MSDKIKIGFVGAGFMGQLAHLKNYAELDTCEVVAISEPREKLANSVARKYNIPKVYKNHIELIENGGVDAIVAAQPFECHAILLPDILKAKIPLFTEKPLAVSVEAGEELAKLARENNTLYMLGYHKRSDVAMQYAESIIDEWQTTGEYGKMTYVRATMPAGDWIASAGGILSSDEPYPPVVKEKPLTYFTEKLNKDYVDFVNYYIHQVNAMRFLLGEDYKLTYADKQGFMFAVEGDSGVTGVVEMSPYTNTTDWQEKYLICFEKGYIEVSLPAPLVCQEPGSVVVMRDNGSELASYFSPILPKVHAMKSQAQNFIAAVKGERGVVCTPEDAVKDLIIAKEYIKFKNNL